MEVSTEALKMDATPSEAALPHSHGNAAELDGKGPGAASSERRGNSSAVEQEELVTLTAKESSAGDTLAGESLGRSGGCEPAASAATKHTIVTFDSVPAASRAPHFSDSSKRLDNIANVIGGSEATRTHSLRTAPAEAMRRSTGHREEDSEDPAYQGARAFLYAASVSHPTHLPAAAGQAGATILSTHSHLPPKRQGDAGSKTATAAPEEDKAAYRNAALPEATVVPAEAEAAQLVDAKRFHGLGAARAILAEEKDNLPGFADAENIAIHDEIRAKQLAVFRRETATGQKAERVQMMRQHLQQLRAEILQLESLACAKASHITSEKHMEGVALRQISKLRGEMRQRQQQEQQIQNRLTGLQLDIVRGQELIDCFKLRMKWNEDELAQWRSAALQKEEDLRIIGDFKRQDDARAAELMTQTQRVSIEVAEARKRLREEETSARAARAELQRSLEQFSEQQKDRALLITQGETAVQAMWKADNRIARSTKTFEKVQEAVNQQLKKLASARGFAMREKTQNKTLQEEISRVEQQLDNAREQYASAAAAASQLAEQVAGLKGQLSAAATRGKAAKRQLAELHESLAGQQQRLEALRRKKETAEKRLKKEKDNFRSAGEAGEASEVFHLQAAARLHQLQQRIKTSRDSLLAVSQSLAEEKATLKRKRGGLSSSKNALKSLQAQLQQQEAERSRQQELLYSIDFQCQAMQRRLSLASGYKTAAETKALQKRIKELQAESTLQQEEHSALSAQVKHIEGELRLGNRSLMRVDAEDSRCSSSVGEVRLACTSIDREMQIVLKEKEELVLAESLKKLEVNKLHEEVEACADASLEAENRKLQQQLHAQEALGAADTDLDAAKGQLRAVEEERHKLAKEALERRAKLAGLESRYENIVQSSQPAEGAGRSQAYYLIRAGQEREELQRLSAALHRRLQTATAEVEGLEATVRDVRLCNSRLRSKLQEENEALSALKWAKEEKESALFLRKHMMFTHHQQIEALKKAIEVEQKCFQDARNIHQGVLEELAAAEKERKQLESRSGALDEKLKRTLQQLRKLQNSIHERRTAVYVASESQQGNVFELCNMEMKYHAESIEALLQGLYTTIG
ncbi:hypothetical protein Efla_002889 [Eimeria flavescens]